eukprot:TRINITY_DN3258_c0_g2_i1.p1 TRINITY_DN3258_c0_g2~~TRINITY_DN3258_c0_g2_i1.p1  ORF type:complete len:193 (+),score=20.81 TRINITY_DN3258_c0_g2_i1:212-790(+)
MRLSAPGRLRRSRNGSLPLLRACAAVTVCVQFFYKAADFVERPSCRFNNAMPSLWSRRLLVNQQRARITTAAASAGSVQSTFRGPVQDYIETTLQAKLSPKHLLVENESHHNIRDESHFHALIVSDAFSGMALLDRHRLVNSLFMDADSKLKFHSLRITARSPEQWVENPEVPAKPRCTGGGDGRPTDLSLF